MPPPRGRILDRNGVVIAGNRPSFRLLVVRDETKDLDQTLDLLGRLLPDTVDRRRAIIRDVNAAPRFSPVPVKSDLSWEEFAKVNLYAPELPGVTADMSEARVYPFGGAFAHVIGYVAKVSDRDIKAIRDKGEEPPADPAQPRLPHRPHGRGEGARHRPARRGRRQAGRGRRPRPGGAPRTSAARVPPCPARTWS